MDIGEAIQALIDWLLGVLQAIADWFLEIIQSLAEWVFDGVLSALATLIESIPLPSWLESPGSVFSGIGSDVAWFASFMDFGFGLGVIVSAFGIRFLIRRLPFVG